METIAFNFEGLIIGLLTFLIIGLFHPIVVKMEYYWGKESWWLLLIVGLIALIVTVFMEKTLWSAIFGVLSFSSFWSIKELFEQEERVKKGWFPFNPKRKKSRKK